MRKLARPIDMVGAAIFLACDESAWVTGGLIVVDGGGTAR
jgi:glucose 1-dehydrogenase/3-oxoacyl-[acyl-carrier protein] reductase